jgi:predicted membrane protein
MEDYIIPAIGYLPPPLPAFPLSFDQIAIIGFVLMGVVIAIPLVTEGYLQIRNRRRPSVEENEVKANDTAAEEALPPAT